MSRTGIALAVAVIGAQVLGVLIQAAQARAARARANTLRNDIFRASTDPEAYIAHQLKIRREHRV